MPLGYPRIALSLRKYRLFVYFQLLVNYSSNWRLPRYNLAQFVVRVYYWSITIKPVSQTRCAPFLMNTVSTNFEKSLKLQQNIKTIWNNLTYWIFTCNTLYSMINNIQLHLCQTSFSRIVDLQKALQGSQSSDCKIIFVWQKVAV